MAHSSNFNHDLFSEINEESSYWAGFILADGYIYNNSIRIGISSIDSDHLGKFKHILRSENKIYLYEGENNYSKVGISSFMASSPKLVSDLYTNFGIDANKSTYVNLHDNAIYNKHFWRGYIDGDGWLSFQQRSKSNNRVALLAICGLENVCLNFKDFCLKYIDTKAKPYKHKNKNLYVFNIHSNKAKLMINEIYGDANIYLSRKINRAYEILNG